MEPPFNVLGGMLASCSHDPLTGWRRDGCCNTDAQDHGSHTICARVTREFLEFIRERGNDLITPHPEFGFPGLVDGDQWCVCAASWRQAFKEGKACPVQLESTHAGALRFVPLEELMLHAIATEV